MSTTEPRSSGVPWIFFPFVLVWRLVAGIVGLVGRIVATILGVVFLIAGVALTMTVAGAIIGIPLFALGMMLVARGLF